MVIDAPAAVVVLVALRPRGAQGAAAGFAWIGLIAFESVRFSEMRERVRHEEDVAVSRFSADGSG